MKSIPKSVTCSASSVEDAIDGLLAVHHAVDHALPSAAAGWLSAGDVVGRYHIIRPLGEGGMGEVFLAEQRRPVHREVALKVIKPGLVTRQFIRRFESERQALALMEHPNITRVLDAGATDRGLPFLVMERVRGFPITDFCRRENLDLRAKLTLFIKICNALQHAHQKNVVHRDLKPSNILVGWQDGVPEPKVIDFGIAKAASADRHGDWPTTLTLQGQVLGTPVYTSPEQLGGQASADCLTDIYSLGAILYELLTDEPPFSSDRLNNTTFHEICRIIGEEDPPKPRSGIPRQLGWIAFKALAKSPRDRYHNAAGLAADVRRFLDGQAVSAGPPPPLCRMGRTVRRHHKHFSISAIAGVLLALTIAIAGRKAAQPHREQPTQILFYEDFDSAPPGRRSLPAGWQGDARSVGFDGELDFAVVAERGDAGKCLRLAGNTIAGRDPNVFSISMFSKTIPGPLPTVDLSRLRLTAYARGDDLFNVAMFRIESSHHPLFASGIGWVQFTTTVSPAFRLVGGPLSEGRQGERCYDPRAPYHRIVISINHNTWYFDAENVSEWDNIELALQSSHGSY